MIRIPYRPFNVRNKNMSLQFLFVRCYDTLFWSVRPVGGGRGGGVAGLANHSSGRREMSQVNIQTRRLTGRTGGYGVDRIQVST